MRLTIRATLAAVFALAVVASTQALFGINPAAAAGGDIQSIDFTAEDPDEYDHSTGGGFYGSDADGDGKNTVESLQGGDFACGDIVSYFVQLVVEGDGSDDPQTIQLTNTFTADATGQDGAGLTDVVNVVIDPADPAQSNDGDSTVTIIDEGVDADGAAPYANDGSPLSGGADSTYVTYQVDGLETGGTVIVRIDVLLECAPNSSPTGNLQGNLTEADIVAINDGQVLAEPDAVAGGNQTIPFQQIGDLAGAGEPTLDIQKTVMAVGGTCGVDDVESLDITVGDTVTYCYLITNAGTLDLENAAITDDAGTPSDTSDDFTIAVGTVPAVSSVYSTEDVTIDETGTVVNTATATGDGPRNSTLTDSDTATVVSTGTPSLAIDKELTEHVDGDGDGDVEASDTLNYTVTATNDGDVPLTDVTVSDDLTGDSITCPTLAPTETCVLTTSYVVTVADVAAGQVSNTATAESDETDPVTDAEYVPVVANPALAVDKVLTNNDDADSSGGVSLGDTLTYTITATNTGDIELTNVIVSDNLTGDSDTCATVPVDGTCVLTVTYVVTQDDVDAGVINNVGTAGSDQTDPVDEPENVPVDQIITIDLVKEGSLDVGDDGIATPGDLITYEFTVTNIGTVTLTGISVTDPGVNNLDCAADTLAPGTSTTCSATYAITQADIDAGRYDNTASVDTNEGATDTDDHSEPILGEPGLDVDKVLIGNDDVDASGGVSLGDTLTYSITATNTGNTTLQITVEDSLTGDSTTCADVAPTGTCVLTVMYKVTQDDVDAGVINNVGIAGSDQTDPVEEPEDVPVDQIITIDLVKDGELDLGDDGIATPGDVIAYSLDLTNTGTVTLTGISVSDPGVTGLTCDTDTLAPEEFTTCSASYAITQADIDAGVYDNTASVSTNEGASDTDGHSEPIPRAPSLDVDKVLTANDDADGSGGVSLGDTLTYTITATNTGNTTLQVSVGDSLTGDSAACADVAPAGTCTLVVTYEVTQADVDAGVINNVGTAGSDQTDPVEDPETVDVPQFADIDLIKSGELDDGGDGVADVGDSVDYTFDVTNTGNVTLTDVIVTDELLGGTVCTIATLAPGEPAQCTGSYTLTQGDIDAGTVDNAALAEGTPPAGAPPVTDTDDDGNPDDPGDAIVDIPEAPAIELTKSGELDLGADGIANPGDDILYTLEVTNTGNVTLSNVEVNDPKLGGLVCSFPTLAVGASETCTGSYTLTQTDVDAGIVENTATADGDSPQGTNVDDEADADVDVPQIITLTVDKLTNGADDNTILAGSTVTWTYEVTNTGTTTLDSLVVTDSDPAVVVACPDTTLAPGASTTCSATGTAEAGDYTNTGTAEADGPQDQPATDADDSSYFGADPSFTVDKVTTTSTGTGDGEYAVEGEPITWTYTIENTGNIELTIDVTDDVEGVVCTETVAAGATATCTLNGTANEGSYNNTGTGDSTYTDDLGNTANVSDSDESGYIGINSAQPSIQFTEGTYQVTPFDDDTGFDATVEVTNESDGLEADTVVITDFNVIVEEMGKRNTSTPVEVNCTVNGQDTGDLADPIVFNESTILEFSCTTADGEPLRGRHRITIEAQVLNRDHAFTERTVIRF